MIELTIKRRRMNMASVLSWYIANRITNEPLGDVKLFRIADDIRTSVEIGY